MFVGSAVDGGTTKKIMDYQIRFPAVMKIWICMQRNTSVVVFKVIEFTHKQSAFKQKTLFVLGQLGVTDEPEMKL